MGLAIVELALGAVNTIAELCHAVIEAGDSEKHAKSVNELNQGIDDTFSEMRQLIKNDERLSVENKLERLENLARLEAKAKKDAGAEIKDNREHTAKVAMDVLKGFLTCGLYFTPAIIREAKKAMEGSSEQSMIETHAVDTEEIPEETAANESDDEGGNKEEQS